MIFTAKHFLFTAYHFSSFNRSRFIKIEKHGIPTTEDKTQHVEYVRFDFRAAFLVEFAQQLHLLPSTFFVRKQCQ